MLAERAAPLASGGPSLASVGRGSPEEALAKQSATDEELRRHYRSTGQIAHRQGDPVE